VAKATIGFGVALILLGLGAYFGSGRESMTAMIPAFFGVAIAVCGGVALRPAARRPAIIAAAVVGALGFIGSLSRILPKVVRGEEIEMGLAIGAQLVMAVITAAFVGMCVWWFLQGRRAGGAEKTPV
jgi:hypothetical protein